MTLRVITSDVADSPPAPHERKLRDRRFEAWTEANKNPTKATVEALWRAGDRYADWWMREAQRCRRLLTRTLMSEAVSGDTRATIIATRYGTERDAKLLTAREAALIQIHRLLTPTERRAIWEIVNWAQAAQQQRDGLTGSCNLPEPVGVEPQGEAPSATTGGAR